MSESSLTASRLEREDRLREKLMRELGREVLGLLADKTVVEVMLNADGALWAERAGQGMARIGAMSAPQAEALMATIAAARKPPSPRKPYPGRELPLDGSRFEGLIPPVAPPPSSPSAKERA